MVLTKEDRQEIEDFVREKPRNIQEIAEKVGRSWRTADRYVRKIAEQEGTISTRTFRKGTRGALKVVYWNSEESLYSSQFKERLYTKIESGRDKRDFSPFDIYQCVDEEQRDAFLEQQSEENVHVKHDLAGTLQQAEDQVLIFSGNLSWANLQQEGRDFLDVFEELGERGVSVKFLGKVDVTSVKNAQKLLKLNRRFGEDRLTIRHQEQPLRAFVVDDRLVRFKEIQNPEKYKEEELDRTTYVFYEIYDRDWVEWLTNVFWTLYRGALPARKRIDDLETIHNLEEL